MDEKQPDQIELNEKENDATATNDTLDKDSVEDTNIVENVVDTKRDMKLVDLTLSRNNLDYDVRVKPETKIYIDLGDDDDKGEDDKKMRWEPIHAYYSYSQPGQYPGGGGGGGGWWGQQQPAPYQAPPYQAPPYQAPPYQAPAYGHHQGYESSGPRMWGAPEQHEFDYDDPKSRNRFVKKVFILTFVALMIVTAVCITTRQFTECHKFFRSLIGLGLVVIAMIIILIIDYSLMCCSYCQRSPCSWIALTLMVIAMTYVTAFITIKYNTPILMVAMAVTAGIVLICIGLACTSFDFTKFYIYFLLAGLGVALLALIFVGLRFAGIYYKPVHIALTVVVTLVQIVGLVMHLQMILGGRSIEFDEDDIAVPTLILFSSIITIFLNILTLLHLTDAF